MHVLVPAAREVEDDDGRVDALGPQLSNELGERGHGVRGLQRRNDALGLRQHRQRLQGTAIVHTSIARTPGGVEHGVLGADARVVEAGGDGVCLLKLPVLRLQHQAAHAVIHADPARRDRGGVPVGVHAVPGRLDTHEAHALVRDEAREDAHGVAPAADARHHRVWESPLDVKDLRAALVADDPMEFTDHGGIGIGAHHASDEVVRVLDVRDPVPERLVDRVLERRGPGVYGAHLRTEESHPKHVQSLPRHVLRAHVDHAGHAEVGAHGRGGHAVLPRPGLGDNPGLPQSTGEKRLPYAVVDLVRARVVQIFALEVDPRPAADGLREPGGQRQRARSSHVVPEDLPVFSLELRVGPRLRPGPGQLLDSGHKGLGDEPPSELSKVSGEGRRHMRCCGRFAGAHCDVL